MNKELVVKAVQNARSFKQHHIVISEDIKNSLNIYMNDSLYFVYDKGSFKICKKLKKSELNKINKFSNDIDKLKKLLPNSSNFSEKRKFDYMWDKSKLFVKLIKVTGAGHMRVTIPTYICEKLNIKDKDVLTYEVLEDCVRINLEV